MVRLGDRAEGEGMGPGRYNVGPRNGAGETMPYRDGDTREPTDPFESI